jgi:glycosyltransferase involved in cell wall biosynthesis
MDKFPQYDFEYILADNGSTDHTADILRTLAEKDKRIKVILNMRNFGAERSGYNVSRHFKGDCCIGISADLEDPPELIEEFIKQWEKGYKAVLGIRNGTKKNPIVNAFRTLYYKTMKKISNTEQIENFIGFGLYDRSIYVHIFANEWPVPYTRGLIAEYVGKDYCEIKYVQGKRKYGKSSYNFLRYLDEAMRGVTLSSTLPLRLATVFGFILSGISLVTAIVYLIMKLLNWNSMPFGFAPLLIGIFFFSSVQIALVGLVGEYVMRILEFQNKKKLVIEKELINFDTDTKDSTKKDTKKKEE